MPDREWVRSDRRVENPGIRKEEDELRLDFWTQIRSTGWDERKCSSLVLVARLETASIPLKNPEGVRGEEEAETEWAEGNNRFEGESATEGAKLDSKGIQAGGVREVKGRDAALEVRAAKSPEFGEL